MALTKSQLRVIDAVRNGGYVWKAGSTVYLARQTGNMTTGQPIFQSETLNARTFRAIEGLLNEEGRLR